MNTLPPTYKFSVEKYCRLYEAEIVDEYDRLELVSGQIFRQNEISVGHAQTTTNLNSYLGERAGGRFMVSPANPLELDLYSLPQPDLKLIVVDRNRRRYVNPSDVFLLIEVADTSLGFDRAIKLPAYAQAGIAEYWIVNLIDHVFEVYRQPRDDAYLESSSYGLGSAVAPAAFPDVVLKVADIIPAR